MVNDNQLAAKLADNRDALLQREVFTKRYPLDTKLVNPLVLFARKDPAVMGKVAAMGRAAWMREAERLSKRLWHLATVAPAGEVLLELLAQPDHGRADLDALDRVMSPASREGSASQPAEAEVEWEDVLSLNDLI